MVYLIMYLLSIPLNYYVVRYYVRVLRKNDWGWNDVEACALVSFTVIPFIIVACIVVKKKLPPNPPKWL